MKALNESMDSILRVQSRDSSGTSQDSATIDKYLMKLSTLTAPTTEDDFNDIGLVAANAERDLQVIQLTKRLEEKEKFATVLEQGVRSARASEDVLNSQIDSQRQIREALQKEIKETKASTEIAKIVHVNRGKKGVSLKKEINRLELQLKDLQVTMEQTIDKERRASGQGTESVRKARELMRELIEVRINNTRFLENNESKGQQLMETKEKVQGERDGYVRDANAARVKVIALKKKYEETADDIVKLNELCDELEESLAALRMTMATEQALEGARIKDLQTQLTSEEGANRALCAKLGEKARFETRLRTDLKTAIAARTMLSEQLEEKMKLSLELGARIKHLMQVTQAYELRLSDKNLEAETLGKSLDMVKSDVKVLELQLTKEEHNMLEADRVLKEQQAKVVFNGSTINEKVDKDQTMSLAISQIEANSRLLKEDLSDRVKAQESLKMRVMTVEERKMMLQQQVEDLESSFSEMTERLKQVIADHQRTELNLKIKTKDLLQDEHNAKLKLAEIQNTLKQRTDTIVTLKNGLMLDEVKVRDLTEMLEGASVSAEKNRQLLTRRVTELTQSNKLLAEETQQEKSRGALLETDLVNVEGRLRSSLAQLKAQGSTAAGISSVNNQDQEMVMKRLEDQTAKIERLNQERVQVLSDIQSWNIKLEDQGQDKDRVMKLMRQEKGVTNKLRDRAEDELDRELEQKSRVKMLTKHNSALDVDLADKVESVADVKIEVDDFESQVDIQAEELRAKELKNEELVGIQNSQQKQISILQVQLKNQEQAHLADARAVKLSIISLQDALMDKVQNVEQLVRTTQQTKARITELASRLETTQNTAATVKRRNEDMLSEEQSVTATLRGLQENRVREKQVLEEGISNKTARIGGLQSSLVESGNRAEVLQSDTSTKHKEADMMAEQLMQKEAIETKYEEQIFAKEEDIAKYRATLRSRGQRIMEAQKEVRSAQFENKLLRKQLQEKSKAERYLLAELEGLRLQVNKNKNPGNVKGIRAQIKADAAFTSVLAQTLNK